jgi:hypothetical protein
MLTTDQKGAVAEMAMIHAAIKLGISVYTPVAERGRYDMIFELGSRLVRVQCKWAPRRGDVVVLRCYGARRNRDGLLTRVYVEGRSTPLRPITLTSTAATSYRSSSSQEGLRFTFGWGRAGTIKRSV